MKRSSLASLIGVAIAGGVAVFAITQQAPGPGRLRSDAEALQLGAKVYATHCASCHGAKLEGQADWRARGGDGILPAPPHDASGHTWHHSDEVLFKITKYGVAKAADLKDYRSAMPAFEGTLTDAEIVAVLSWIKSQWPAEIQKKQEQIR